MRRVGPGPGKYLLPSTIGCKDHDPRKQQNPCYSIGNRTKVKANHIGPGPGKYSPGKYNRYGKEHFPAFIGETLHTRIIDQAPAPNAYKLPDILGKQRSVNAYTRRSPDFIIGNRINDRHNTGTPAPNAYKLPNMIGQNTGINSVPKAPVYSIGNRLHLVHTSITPGPAKYLPQFDDKGKILTTLKFRPSVKLRSDTPAPNEYSLQFYKPGKNGPAYTIGRKYPDWIEPMILDEDN